MSAKYRMGKWIEQIQYQVFERLNQPTGNSSEGHTHTDTKNSSLELDLQDLGTAELRWSMSLNQWLYVEDDEDMANLRPTNVV